MNQSFNAETSGTEERQISLSDRVLKAFTQPRRRPATQDEEIALANAEREDFAWRGEKLAVWRWGDGTPVLLLHGWESRASHMTGFVPEILRAGFSVVALDAPAHGNSTGEYTNVLDYGRSVVALARHIGVGSHVSPLAGVVAHSVGSAAALYAYALGLHTNASVQLCGPSSLKRVFYGSCLAAGVDRLHRVELENRLEASIGASLSTMDLSELAIGMRHPALVIHDPSDPEIPVSESQALAQAWERSELELVEGPGHRRLIRDERVIARSVQFLASNGVSE